MTNAEIKLMYAKGTRVHDTKEDRDGVIVWQGRDRPSYGSAGLVRIGVKWDGTDKTVFRGIHNIERADGLCEALIREPYAPCGCDRHYIGHEA